MFCTKCGNELKNAVSFCPYCGNSLLAKPLIEDEQKIVNRPARKLKKRYILAALLVVIVLIAAYNTVRIVELSMVKSEVERHMEVVKTGPDSETMKAMVDEMIQGTIENKTIASVLSDHISGEDALDIYHAVMRHMSYRVTDVRKIETGHYQVTIEVTNLNNRLIAGETCKSFINRYTGQGISGAVIQGIEDLSSDKSQTIASVFNQVSDQVYSLEDKQYYVSGEYTIDINKVDGEWVPTIEQGMEKFLLGCAGI